jgi:AAA family ATPase
VDLKYITNAQIVEVLYESSIRQFSLDSVSPTPSAEDEVVNTAAALHALSIDPSPRIWTVGWDSTVSIVEDEVNELEKASLEAKNHSIY